MKKRFNYSAFVNEDGTTTIVKEEKKMSKGKKIGIFAVIAAALAGIGGGIWYFFNKKVDEPDGFYEESNDESDEDPDEDDVEITEF